jgi:hypothetical protein
LWLERGARPIADLAGADDEAARHERHVITLSHA